MTRRRTTVFADEDDLTILRAAARSRGIPEAELIREAIHLAALANKVWTESFFSRTYVPESAESVETALTATWSEKAASYARAKSSPE